MIMKIINEIEGKYYSLNTKELEINSISSSFNEISNNILKILSKEPMYPKQLAKNMNMHEQKIYYYIKKLEKDKLIIVDRQENINGTIANFYKTSADSFFIKIKDFKESSKIQEKKSKFLEPFITNNELNALIVVGSPEPHGPQKARSRDGYYGMDLALFLGTFLSFIPESKVKLDTEVTDKDIENNNLIVIGGPIVNKVTSMVNNHMKVRYDEDKKGIYSDITKKTYFNDEIGMINKFDNPFNSEKKILLLAGLRNAGTKATIIGFLKHFSEIKRGNNFKRSVYSKVVEGLDLDSDGTVDDCEFLE